MLLDTGYKATDLDKNLQCVNGSGEVIPPFSACKISSVDALGAVTVVKPDEDNLAAIVLSPSYPVPIGADFEGISPYDEYAAINGSAVIGGNIGTISGQWYMETDRLGFKHMGGSGGSARIRPFSSAGNLTKTSIGGFTWSGGSTGTGNGTVYSPWFTMDSSVDIRAYSMIAWTKLGATLDPVGPAALGFSLSIEVGKSVGSVVDFSGTFASINGVSDGNILRYLGPNTSGSILTAVDIPTGIADKPTDFRFRMDITIDPTVSWTGKMDDYKVGPSETLNAFVF